MDLRVWIQAHPSRTELHRKLRLELASLDVRFSYHSSNPPNPWAGYRQVMERAVDGGGTHFVVMQDDVTLCRDFPLAVTNAVEERPDEVLSLWVGGLRNKTTKDYMRAMQAGESWSPIHFSDICHVVGLAWPRLLTEEFLNWTETSMLPGDGRDQQSDDAIVGAWMRRTHQTVWAMIPSLLEHQDDVESTIGRPRGDRGRRAIYFDSPSPAAFLSEP